MIRGTILELSPYLLGPAILLYFLLSAVLTGISVHTRHARNRVGEAFLGGLVFFVHALGMAVVYVRTQDDRVLFLYALTALLYVFVYGLHEMLLQALDTRLISHALMLFSIGLIEILRLDMTRGIRQCLIGAVGLILLGIMPYLMGRVHYRPYLLPLLAGVGPALLLAVLVYGSVTQGSKLNFTVFDVAVQPSEFVKISFILCLAGIYLHDNGIKGFLEASGVALIHVLLLVAARDLGSALIYFILYLFMSFLGTGWWALIPGGFLLMGGGGVLGYRLFEHVRVRLRSYLTPWEEIEGVGYQITQALFAISAGGLLGRGIGGGDPGRIPFVVSDFIYAAIAEEYGLLAALSILGIFLVVFFEALQGALRYPHRYERLSIYGFGILLVFQTFLTVGGQIRFIPLTGVTIPLVSYGGSSLLSSLIVFGFVESIRWKGQKRMDGFRRRYALEHPEDEDGLSPVEEDDLFSEQGLTLVDLREETEDLPEMTRDGRPRAKGGGRERR